MITLSKTGNTIKFTFSNHDGYLKNGEIWAPVNSLMLVTDNSDMAVFKKASNGDIFIAAHYGDFGKTKAELISWYQENAVRDYGVSENEVETMLDGLTLKQVTQDAYDALVSGGTVDEHTVYIIVD